MQDRLGGRERLSARGHRCDFTAKEFRTWAGTLLAARELAACGPSSSKTEAKRNVVAAVKRVAARLGNRPATCRNYYVHPAIVEAYVEGTLPSIPEAVEGDATAQLRADEVAVLAIIESAATQGAKRPAA